MASARFMTWVILFMLKQLASVRASDLEQALLILPFFDALRLLSYFCTWLERG